MSALRPDLARRIVQEYAAVSAKFPSRFRLAPDPAGRPIWHGAVAVEERDFPIIITYPAAYPALPPTLETTALLPHGCPHVLKRNSERSTLCWIAPISGKVRRRWHPQHHTAATVIGAAQRWALAFLVWQQLHVWPVPDAWEE